MENFKKGNNCFYLGENEKDPKAIITFSRGADGNYIIIDHTEVEEDLRGNHIASHLVDKVVDYARENNLKLKATCWFAKEQLDLNKDQYNDVLM